MANAKQKKGFTKKILGGSELTMEEYAAYITALKAKPFLTSAEASTLFEIGIGRVRSLMKADDADFVVMTDTIRSRPHPPRDVREISGVSRDSLRR